MVGGFIVGPDLQQLYLLLHNFLSVSVSLCLSIQTSSRYVLMYVFVCVHVRTNMCRWESVHVNGVEDPLCELLELGSRCLGLLLQSLVVLPEPLDLSLKPHLFFTLLMEKENVNKCNKFNQFLSIPKQLSE